MVKTITKTFASAAALHNVREDLVAKGILQEEIFIDKKKMQVKVMIPSVEEAEILEILGRHQPLD
jgi:hypothetical protein